jgi:hypothetical protein
MVGHHACMEEVTFCELVQWVHPCIWRENGLPSFTKGNLQRNEPSHTY